MFCREAMQHLSSPLTLPRHLQLRGQLSEEEAKAAAEQLGQAVADAETRLLALRGDAQGLRRRLEAAGAAVQGAQAALARLQAERKDEAGELQVWWGSWRAAGRA